MKMSNLGLVPIFSFSILCKTLMGITSSNMANQQFERTHQFLVNSDLQLNISQMFLQKIDNSVWVGRGLETKCFSIRYELLPSRKRYQKYYIQYHSGLRPQYLYQKSLAVPSKVWLKLAPLRQMAIFHLTKCYTGCPKKNQTGFFLISATKYQIFCQAQLQQASTSQVELGLPLYHCDTTHPTHPDKYI